MRVIYADTLFLINFAADYLALLAAGKIAAARLRRGRLALSAAAGALWAVLAAATGSPVLCSAPAKIAVGALMAALPFWRGGFPLRETLLFFAFSALLGGAAAALSGGAVSLKALAAAFAGSLALSELALRGLGRRAVGGLVHIELRRAGRSASFTALRDTGNALRDPISGDGVIIAEASAILPLFDGKTGEILLKRGLSAADKAARLASGPARWRVIPYSSVGVEGGLLLAFRPDAAYLDGKKRPGLLVALSPTPLSEGGGYSAIA